MQTDTATRFIARSAQALHRAFVDPEAPIARLPPAGMAGRVLRFDRTAATR
jgi:hypothetical protein